MNAQDSPLQLPARAGDIAARIDARLVGDEDTEINGVATLSGARAGQVSFLANPAYRDALRESRASAVLVPEQALQDCPSTALVLDDPYAGWARLLGELFPPAPLESGIHPSAIVASGARVDESAAVGPLATIGAGASLGPGVRVGPHCVVGDGVELGSGTQLVARVYVGGRARLGHRVLVHPGAVIGADGFGLAMVEGSWCKVPQLGSVVIGDDCEIGANTTIDRGAIEDTVLGADVRLDNQVQIAHNVRIGAHTAIAGCVGIAGSTCIGSYCMIAGASGIGGHLEICDRVIITAMSTVLQSITEPGEYGSGIPARPQRAWQRTLVRLSQLDRLFRRARAGRPKD
jgi:UDP-3-O-[3-hydroxymyristoyl] glucosamine N-acyltransferase